MAEQEKEVNAMCECYAVISEDDPRAEIWGKVDPERRIPLKHPLYVKATEGQFQGMIFYEGDTSRLSLDQLQTISKEMERKFNIPAGEVLADLMKGILPVKTDNCTVFICELHFRCMM